MKIITDWRMKDVWNNASLRPDRPLAKRDYCYASELAKPLIDRFLSMNAVEPTNPPNMRSRRKFLMGEIIEEMQGIVISLLGLRTDMQQQVNTNGIISVHGRIDFLVQGIPNYEKARFDVAKLGFSQSFIDYLTSVINEFERKMGDCNFAPMVRECKSCSEYLMNTLQEGGFVIGHKLQLFHYLKGLNLPLGYVDYISKGDSLMEDTRVEYPDDILEAQYNNSLSELKGYLDSNQRPPADPLIIFEGKFKKNFGVEYSNYLELVYGYKTPQDYSDTVKGKIASWNRVLARIKDVSEGKRNKPTKAEPLGALVKLTDKNKVVIEEMAKDGLDAYELAIVAKVDNEEEEDDL